MKIYGKIDASNLLVDLQLMNDGIDVQDACDQLSELFGGTYVLVTNSVQPQIGDYFDGNQFYAPIQKGDGRTSLYVNLPNGTSYCMIFRNASSLFSGLICRHYYGNPSRNLQVAATNLRLLKLEDAPTGIPHAIIRDPVDRFRSAYGLKPRGVPCWLSATEFIDWLVSQNYSDLDAHFRPQTILCGTFPGLVLHDFAKDLTPVAEALGLPTPLPLVNQTPEEDKPTLTDEDVAKLQTFYADDVALYNLVTRGVTLTTN
jgi:hypothetical protein